MRGYFLSKFLCSFQNKENMDEKILQRSYIFVQCGLILNFTGIDMHALDRKLLPPQSQLCEMPVVVLIMFIATYLKVTFCVRFYASPFDMSVSCRMKLYFQNSFSLCGISEKQKDQNDYRNILLVLSEYFTAGGSGYLS